MEEGEPGSPRAVTGSPRPGPPRLRAELSARGLLPPTGNRRLRAHPAGRERRPLPARSGEAHVGSSLQRGRPACRAKGAWPGGAWPEKRGWPEEPEAPPTPASQGADPQEVFGGFAGGRWPRMRSESLQGPASVVNVPPSLHSRHRHGLPANDSSNNVVLT